MRDRLTDALKVQNVDYVDIRLEDKTNTWVAFRGPDLDTIGSGRTVGGIVRALYKGGWGYATFNDLQDLPKRVGEACETARLVGTGDGRLRVDGRMLAITAAAGGTIINPDRMWHYTEGVRNWNPIWPNHGIRILPGPSSLWLDPTGKRLPFPHIPGASSLDTLQHITTHEYPYTWFLLNRTIIKREFALSGSEQNPDLTGKDLRLTLKRMGKAVQGPVQAFMDKGADFIVRDNLRDLVAGMNKLIGDDRVDYAMVEQEVHDRDSQTRNVAGKDAQLAIVRNARAILSERLVRIAIFE